MKPSSLFALAATGVVALTATVGRLAIADETQAATCPVSGRPAKVDAGAAWTHVNGQAVYFCCENCPKAFAADPEKFASKMALKCPVMKANAVKPAKNLRLAVNNGYVYTCCGGCPAALLKSPEKFLTELRDPVSGANFKLNADTPHSDYKNAHFYFASAENKKAFDEAPEKYAHVLGS